MKNIRRLQIIFIVIVSLCCSLLINKIGVEATDMLQYSVNKELITKEEVKLELDFTNHITITSITVPNGSVYLADDINVESGYHLEYFVTENGQFDFVVKYQNDELEDKQETITIDVIEIVQDNETMTLTNANAEQTSPTTVAELTEAIKSATDGDIINLSLMPQKLDGKCHAFVIKHDLTLLGMETL